MYQIKIFKHDSVATLEEEVNTYLKGLANSTKVELKYQVEHRAITTDSETGVYSEAEHTIIVIMN
ncbi:hypothetical protein D3C80_2188360 [compost metagenome]